MFYKWNHTEYNIFAVLFFPLNLIFCRFFWLLLSVALIFLLLCCAECSVMPHSLRPHGPLSGSSVHGDSPGKNTSVGCHALLQGNLPNPEIEPRSPTLQVYSSLSEPPGKAMNTGVGSLFFLQGIFPTQELNWGLLHCRQILNQLSYQGYWLVIFDLLNHLPVERQLSSF